jgi:ribosome modulation factor
MANYDEAYMRGRIDRAAGAGRGDCPYRDNMREASAWIDGWIDGGETAGERVKGKGERQLKFNQGEIEEGRNAQGEVGIGAAAH